MSSSWPSALFDSFGAGIPSVTRQRIGLSAGQMARMRRCSVEPIGPSASKPCEFPFSTGSRLASVNASSTMSPTLRPSGWKAAVRSPSSMARSRLVSRRTTVTFLPPPSMSITWPSRITSKRWKVSVSVCGSQLCERPLTMVSADGVRIRKALSV